MFGPDPINIFDPSPYGALAYYGHYLIGTVVLIAALVAFAARKGRGLHRIAGLIYLGGVFLLGLTSISMLADRMIPPLAMAVITSFYAVGGAYLALQKESRLVRALEIGLSLILLLALTGFFVAAIPVVREGLIPPYAPFVIAIIPAILLAGDALWHLKQRERSKRRVARHLSRMIWGFVVVLRAPLVEIAAAGAPIPPPVVIFGPILLALAMLAYFLPRFIRATSQA